MFNLLTITAMRQAKGRFEVHDLGNFKLHVSMKQVYASLSGEAGLEDLGKVLYKEGKAY